MNNLCLSERKGFSPLFMPCFIFKKKYLVVLLKLFMSVSISYIYVLLTEEYY